eukprot:1777569-Rhodomonas_salina.1
MHLHRTVVAVSSLLLLSLSSDGSWLSLHRLMLRGSTKESGRTKTAESEGGSEADGLSGGKTSEVVELQRESGGEELKRKLEKAEWQVALLERELARSTASEDGRNSVE